MCRATLSVKTKTGQPCTCEAWLGSEDDPARTPLFCGRHVGSKECSICLCYTRDVRICPELSCNHAFHARCIKRWLTDEQGKPRPEANCPICRAPCWTCVAGPVTCRRDFVFRNFPWTLWRPSRVAVLTTLYIGGVCAKILYSAVTHLL